MTYEQARAYLDSVPQFGSDSVLSLKALKSLLGELGNPQNDLKFIHIAGTNGKGSVLAFTSAILSEAGLRTGRYVSPTVVSYLERIQVDAVFITEEEFADAAIQVQKAHMRMEARGEAGPTVFEAETAAAFLYFRKMQCDLVVLETGLGGLLDATNVVTNTVIAAFTSISRDHMGFLGNTLREIGSHKAGIIKKGCRVVTALQKPEVMEVLKAAAGAQGCPVHVMYPEEAAILEEDYRGQRFTYRNWENLKIPLAGRHQIVNAVTVLGIVEALRSAGYEVPEEAVRKGFLETSWPGRFTCLCEKPLFMADGAHNEEAAQRLRDCVERYFKDRRLILIMGVFKDKEYHKITEIMAPLAAKIYTVSLPDTERTLEAAGLKKIAELYCRETLAMPGIDQAVEAALEEAAEDDVILAFGSLSYLGQVMREVTAYRKVTAKSHTSKSSKVS